MTDTTSELAEIQPDPPQQETGPQGSPPDETTPPADPDAAAAADSAAAGGAPADPGAVDADADASGEDETDPPAAQDETSAAVRASRELVTLGEGNNLTTLAQELIATAQKLGHPADVVDYQPRSGGFVVPGDVAVGYAKLHAEPSAAQAETPKGARRARKSTAARKRSKTEGGAANG